MGYNIQHQELLDAYLAHNGATFDNSLPNAIDTSLGGFDGQAGSGDDFIIGGIDIF
jgi:hypothetical protein